MAMAKNDAVAADDDGMQKLKILNTRSSLFIINCNNNQVVNSVNILFTHHHRRHRPHKVGKLTGQQGKKEVCIIVCDADNDVGSKKGL